MLHFAILIDGGFAKRKLGNERFPATADHYSALIEAIQAHPALASMRLHRVYYYDSEPLESAHEKPLGGGLVEFGSSPVAQRARTLFEQLSQRPFMAHLHQTMRPSLLESRPGSKLPDHLTSGGRCT